MIEASRVTKRYGSFTALQEVSFKVEPGRVVGFLGLNGAGKTTTLRIISSFMPPTSGRVLVDGHDTVRQSDGVRRVLGYLPEGVPLYDDLRVREYLRFRGRLKGVPAREIREAVDRVISRCGLKAKRDSIIGTLSKGYRQRVGLADALVHSPRLLVLDEPTSGLDPDQRLEVRELVRDLGEACTVFLSTHILPEAEAVCDQVIIIHDGRIRASDRLEDLKKGSERVVVRYTGAPLPGHAAPATQEGTGARRETRLETRNREEASRMVEEAVTAGRRVLELSSTTATLESLFIRVTTGREVAS